MLPENEKNIILTGDPERAFDPYTYILLYSYPDILLQNAPAEHLQHIVQFRNEEENMPINYRQQRDTSRFKSDRDRSKAIASRTRSQSQGQPIANRTRSKQSTAKGHKITTINETTTIPEARMDNISSITVQNDTYLDTFTWSEGNGVDNPPYIW